MTENLCEPDTPALNAAISRDRVASALVRVADLWPEGLDAVPGSYEVAMKRDADTIRALADFWQAAISEPPTTPEAVDA